MDAIANCGFPHNGRIVFVLHYRFTDGWSVIVNLDRAGQGQGQTYPVEPGRVLVTTKPGEWLVCADGSW